MWYCKHCKQEFDYKGSQRANHSRWCDKNPKRNDWDKHKQVDRNFGKYKDFSVSCHNCQNGFTVQEREKLFPQKERYFCTIQCANATGGKAKREKYGLVQYTSIAKQHYDEKCIVCGFDEVVDVHHIDENRQNNDPKNLVFLCPNHHALLHRKQASLVKSSIETFILEHWGISAIGETLPLHGRENGSIPLSSTKFSVEGTEVVLLE